jgi:hypothetical protein
MDRVLLRKEKDTNWLSFEHLPVYRSFSLFSREGNMTVDGTPLIVAPAWEAFGEGGF